MPNHEFFRPLGLFTRPGFLTPQECEQLLDVANRSEGAPAKVYRQGESLNDDESRKTLQVALDEQTKEWVAARLRALAPDLRRHFNFESLNLLEMSCLIYRPGDFFQVHVDTSSVQTEDYKQIEKRRISFVVFLNSHNHSTHPFDGGDINFYGLMDIPQSKAYGFPLEPEPGLLIAFRSTVLHGVSTVTEGNRYTLVGWLH